MAFIVTLIEEQRVTLHHIRRVARNNHSTVTFIIIRTITHNIATNINNHIINIGDTPERTLSFILAIYRARNVARNSTRNMIRARYV